MNPSEPRNDSPFGGFAQQIRQLPQHPKIALATDASDIVSGGAGLLRSNERGTTPLAPLTGGGSGELSEDLLEELRNQFCYISSEQKFCERLANGCYDDIKETHFTLKMKKRFVLSSRAESESALSPASRALLYVQENNRCDCALPSLAGYVAGIHFISGERVLVKRNLELLRPAAGRFNTLAELLAHMFGEEQKLRFLTWLQHAYRNAWEIYVGGKSLSQVCQMGLALILCGKSQVGKSYLVRLITQIFGKVVGKSFKNMTGRTDFNYDCAKAIHLCNDDEIGTRTYEQRKEHGQKLKNLLSDVQWIRPLYRDAFTAPLYQRITYCLNDDRDSFSTFPALSDGVRERILALNVNGAKWLRFQNAITREERSALDAKIQAELPALLYYLMEKFDAPEWCLGSSFGCREYIHPEIEKQIENATPDATLRDMILDQLSACVQRSTGDENCDFLVTSRELYEQLATSIHKDGLKTHAKNVISFGMRLTELCKIYPEHFRLCPGRMKNNQHFAISVPGFTT